MNILNPHTGKFHCLKCNTELQWDTRLAAELTRGNADLITKLAGSKTGVFLEWLLTEKMSPGLTSKRARLSSYSQLLTRSHLPKFSFNPSRSVFLFCFLFLFLFCFWKRFEYQYVTSPICQTIGDSCNASAVVCVLPVRAL
jgi:hypothetical protein